MDGEDMKNLFNYKGKSMLVTLLTAYRYSMNVPAGSCMFMFVMVHLANRYEA